MAAQHSPSGDVSAAPVGAPQQGTARVKFLVNTSHPELGAVKKGQVCEVTLDYVRDYHKLGFADLTEDPITETEG